MMNYQTRRLRYYIAEEGGDRMTNISVLCHEMGHVFGLPDLYIRRQQNGSPNPPRFQNPYAESLWQWDLMAVQVNNGRPQHMSAWSKEQLGWIKPAVIDPRVRQKLVLAPIENSPNECIKIPVRADGSEYFFLENRRHIGFDASVPAEGLLIWRVVFGRPVLEAAHGVAARPDCAATRTNVPFPTDHNDAFTPYTKPSSAALTGEELPVYHHQHPSLGRWADCVQRGVWIRLKQQRRRLRILHEGIDFFGSLREIVHGRRDRSFENNRCCSMNPHVVRS